MSAREALGLAAHLVAQFALQAFDRLRVVSGVRRSTSQNSSARFKASSAATIQSGMAPLSQAPPPSPALRTL